MNMVPTSRLLPLAVALGCVALPLAASAVTYTVDVEPTLNDLPVKIEPLPFDGRLVMKLTNQGTVKVRCDLRYDASPQPIGRGYVYLAPGETAEHSFRAKRKWFSVAVAVTCKPEAR